MFGKILTRTVKQKINNMKSQTEYDRGYKNAMRDVFGDPTEIIANLVLNGSCRVFHNEIERDRYLMKTRIKYTEA